MTVCATDCAVERCEAAGHHGLAIAADGSYAARLVVAPGTRDGWFLERWTLGGPEPYAVPLPGAQPEEPGSRVLPLADGRVLLARPVDGRHDLLLLYPSGPHTGEVPLGSVPSPRLRLLPPSPDGHSGYGLTQTDGPETVTAVWRLAGGSHGVGPQQVARVRGVCAGGAWLDHDGRLLALDRTEPPGTSGGRPRTKTVVVDLAAGGTLTPLLELTEHSEDRLVLADPDSGLLLVRSDAPGTERLGWCVLGSERPVRFPETLAPDGRAADAVRRAAGPDAPAGELRGRAPGRRPERNVGGSVAAGRAGVAACGGAARLAGGHRTVDFGRGTAAAVHACTGALRAGPHPPGYGGGLRGLCIPASPPGAAGHRRGRPAPADPRHGRASGAAAAGSAGAGPVSGPGPRAPFHLP